MNQLNILIIGVMFLVLFGCIGQLPGGVNETNETTDTTAYCGDGQINQATEECEQGIDCKDPDKICDIGKCRCLEKTEPDDTEDTDVTGPEKIKCSVNTQANALGANSMLGANDICYDDCQALGAEYVCDMETCFCEKKTQEITCIENTKYVLAGVESPFQAGMQCKDDCNRLGDSYICNPNKCVCEKEEDKPFYCAGNSLAANNQFDASQNVCKDNCKELGDGYKCNANTCICEREDVKEVSCNTPRISATGATIPYDPSNMKCFDDCPEKTYCEPSSCVCKKKNITYCADGGIKKLTPDFKKLISQAETSDAGTVQTEIVSMDLTGGSSVPADSFFDVFVEVDLPGGDFAVDSFFDVFTELTVDTGNGTRDTKPVSTVDSFFDVFTELEIPTQPSFRMSDMICEDNCKVLGTGFTCDPSSCKCEYKPPKEFSCFMNMENLDFDPTTGEIVNNFDPNTYQCKDDCEQASKLFGGTWSCNPKSCICEQVPVKCATNTEIVQKTNENKYDWLYGRCEDNCDKLGTNYGCDPFSCTCVKREPKPTCSSNTLKGFVPGQTVQAGAVCKDDCEVVYGQSYSCDPKLCYCKSDRTYTECGDGVITSPEECDSGSSKTSTCPTGSVCSNCKCIKRIETHTECSNAQCKIVTGSGQNECQTDADCKLVARTLCGNNLREGNEECDGKDNALCQGAACTPNCVCELDVAPYCGDGSLDKGEECEYDNQCNSGFLCTSCKCIKQLVIIQ
jgi:hypothetical protein